MTVRREGSQHVYTSSTLLHRLQWLVSQSISIVSVQRVNCIIQRVNRVNSISTACQLYHTACQPCQLYQYSVSTMSTVSYSVSTVSTVVLIACINNCQYQCQVPTWTSMGITVIWSEWRISTSQENGLSEQPNRSLISNWN